MKKPKQKFAFGIDFQESILQYIVCNRKGYSIINLIQDSYFTLLPHQFIAFTIKKYAKKKKRIPGKVTLKEYLRQLYNNKAYQKYLTPEMRQEVDEVTERIYKGIPKDGDDIQEECVKFAQYVELQSVLENADTEDYTQYSNLQKKIQGAISIGKNIDGHKGIRLIKDVQTRILNRDSEGDVFVTPYWQLNRSQNGGGIKKHSLIMFMGKAKRFKTGTLINFAIACLRRRKKGLYIDMENGEDELATRADQSLLKLSQKKLKSGEFDKKLAKAIRQYARIGAELVIRRLPGGSTMADVQNIMDEYKLDDGLIFDFVVVDYGDLAGAISGKSDDNERISDVYLDMKNLALVNDLDFIATASHVNRPASKREATVYVAEDVAKCIEKVRHLDLCIGIQESPEETEAGILRWEIVDQRNGPKSYSMYFWVNIEAQKLWEFTKAEVNEIRNQTEEHEKRREASKDV